jgi:hypothetical protein
LSPRLVNKLNPSFSDLSAVSIRLFSRDSSHILPKNRTFKLLVRVFVCWIIGCVTRILAERPLLLWSWDSSVGMATGCGLDGRGLIPCKVKTFFSTPQRLYRPWGPASLLSNGYRRRFLGG